MSLRHPPSCVWHRVWHRRQFAFAGVHDTQIQRTPISTTSLNVFSPSSAGRKLSDEEVPPWASDNPDLDEVVLDDAYYEEIGMTREQAMRQQQELMYSVDPEAMPLDEMASVSQDLPEEWRKAIENLEVYGPQALLMAGFRAEEYAVARATLDSLGAHQVKVLPVSQEMLQLPLELAVQQEEIDWSSPRPPQWIMGGAWGSQRTLMFSGLSIKVQATLIELLEAQGLPSVCVTMALQDDAHRKLGDLLAAAVKAQRQAKPSPSIPPWEVPKKANPPPPSSTAASTAGAPSHSAAAAASAGDVKRAIAASLPGRKGPLFGGSSRSSSRSHQGGSSAAPDGLEPLQQLIPPDIARLRLQADPNAEPAGIADLLDLDIPFEDDDISTGSGSPGSSSPGAGSSSSSSMQQPLQDVEDKTQALVDWFTNEADGSPAVELPWEEDEGAQSSRKAAAAGAGFSKVEQWQQQQAAPVPTPAAAAGGAGSSSSGVILAAAEQPAELLLDDLLPPGGVGDMAVAATGNVGSMYSSDGSMQLPRNPRAAAAVGGGFDSPVGGTAAAVGGSESSGDSSMLAAIQAALKSGVNPEQLKQLIDSAAAAAAAASDPIDLMMQDETAAEKAAPSNKTGPAAAAAAAAKARQANPAAANGRANSAGSPPQQQQQQPTKPRPFGPELPPATPQDDAEPLLKLRPEIERAFQNNQVKFVDINKFPKKYKQQYTLAAMQERQRQQQQMQLRQLQHQQQQVGADGDDLQDLPGEPAPPAAAAADTSLHQAQQQQQQQRGRWWQQRQQHSQSLAAKALSELPTGGKLVEVDVADGRLTEMTSDAMAVAADKQLTAMQLQEQSDTVFEGEVQAAEDSQYYADWEAADEDEDEDEAAAEEPIELDEAKLRLLVQSAEQEALDVSRTLAEALAFGVRIPPEVAAAVGVPLPTADQVEAAKEEIVNNIRQMQRHQQEGDVTTSTAMSEQEWAAAGASSSSGVQQHAAEAALVVQQQQEHSAGVKGRTWGSGLGSAVSRARARLAEKKRLQDGQH